MQNLPRLFVDADLEVGKEFPLTRDQAHYLTRVMRVKAKVEKQKVKGIEAADFIVFNNGQEFYAELIQENLSSFAFILLPSKRPDPSNNLTFAFAPIKQARMEEMLNAATQMGVAKLQPVVTERTTEKFPKWERIKKIIIEASEQSGRNSVPELLPSIKFKEFLEARSVQSSDCSGLIFADERTAHKNLNTENCTLNTANCTLYIGPEGGFSPAEFSALDASGATGISLGKTILRAEVAAVAALSLVNNQ